MTSIVGRQNRSAIGSLVERKSRYTRLVHLPNGHDADDVHDALSRVLDVARKDRWSPEDIATVTQQISLYRSWKDLVQGGGCHPLSAYPIRNGKWDWARMGFHSSTDERALLFVFRLLDAEDVFSVKLPVGWQTSRAAVCSGEAKVTTEENVVTVQTPERMRSCVVEL